MNNNFKKFPGQNQNFGQNTTATENVAAVETTVTTDVAEVVNNKTGIFTAKNAKIAGVVLGTAAVVGLSWYGYKRFFGGKKATEKKTTTADSDFEEAK